MSEVTGDMTSAVEAAFAAQSTPESASTTTTETSSASTTATPAGDVSQAAPNGSETTDTKEPGNVPYQRFKEVNEKYGTASKELESLAWAKGVSPNLAQSAIQLLTRAQQNPLAFTEELELLRDHPQFGPQLRSWAAKTLGMRSVAKAPETVEDEIPDADLQFEDGRKTYSAPQVQKLIERAVKQVESRFDERIQPLAKKGETVDQIVAQQTFEKIEAQAKVDAKSEIDDLRQKYPQFDEHKADVRAVMEANPSYTLKQAWAEVLVEKVGPKLAGQHATSVQKKVQAGSANPARPNGAAAPPPATSFREALERELGVS